MLNGSFEQVLRDEGDVQAIAGMQLGAFYAGLAVENAMLGAAHACANPLSQRYATKHGVAIATMLPHVVEWNADAVAREYRELHPDLAARLKELARVAGLPASLEEAGVPEGDIPVLAANAAEQWTGRFNPRPFDANAAQWLYERAW